MKRYLMIPVGLAVFALLFLTVWLHAFEVKQDAPVLMRTVVDATGTEITIPKHPQRVVILNSANLDMYYAVGGTVVGKPRSSYLSPELIKATADVPSIGTIHSPNVEAIIGLHPDLVIGLNVPFNTNLREMLGQAGIPLYINDLNSYDDMIKELEFFGTLTNHEDVARATSERALEGYNEIVRLARAEQGPRTLIIFGAPGSFSMATTASFSGNLLKILGGDNIADRDSSLTGEYVPLSMEYIIKTDPEVIFFISMTKKPDSIDTFKRDMQENSAWQQVSAVKDGRIYYLSGGLFAANPGTKINEALQIMYEDLYGKELPNNALK